MKSLRVIFCCLLFFAFSHLAFAQAGRKVPTPTPEVSVSNQAVKEEPPCEKGLEEVIYIAPTRIRNFIEELNRLGRCGYRLEKADKLSLGAESTYDDLYVFAVVKLDEVGANKYEYEWFVANSPGEIVTQADTRGENGFYFRKNMMFVAGRCGGAASRERSDNETLGALGDLMNLSLGSNGSVFIFERKNGVVKKREYRVLRGADKRGEKALAENQKTLDEYVAKGFRPVGIYYLGSFDSFAILAEKDDAIKPEGEYRILRYSYNATKLFTKLGAEGYQPVMVGWYFAVLQRKSGESTRISYESADKFSGIVKNLPEWSGAQYRLKGLGIYNSDCDLSENKLFFAVPTDAKAKRFEQKFLRMTNVAERPQTTDRYDALREPVAAEKLQEFQRLLQEGYVVRDVFEESRLVGSGEMDAVGVVVIFERELPDTPPLKF